MSTQTAIAELSNQMSLLRWAPIIMLSAVGYTVATVGMKYAAFDRGSIALVLIISGFVLATAAEVFLLRRGDLSVVYITIMGAETLMILTVAAFFGEAINFQRVLGAGCVVAGIALCSH